MSLNSLAILSQRLSRPRPEQSPTSKTYSLILVPFLGYLRRILNITYWIKQKLVATKRATFWTLYVNPSLHQSIRGRPWTMIPALEESASDALRRRCHQPVAASDPKIKGRVGLESPKP